METDQRACPLQVECYAGHKADERPLAFRHHGRYVRVREMLDAWYGPDHTCYRLMGDDGLRYLIRHDRETDNWELIRMDAPTREGAA